jgi:polar amino acid transport system substrate-binding protein
VFSLRRRVNGAQQPTSRWPEKAFRIGMNAGNTTLVTRASDGRVTGVAADVGQFLAMRLGVPYQPVVYPGSAAYTASFGKHEWDVIITGKNPTAAKSVEFLGDVLALDYVFVAAASTSVRSSGEADTAGIRIAVGQNTSADVYLSATLKAATLLRTPGDVTSMGNVLRRNEADLYALGADTADAVARESGGRVLPGSFTTVMFAVAVEKDTPEAIRTRLSALVAEAKTEGIVQRAVDRAHVSGVRLAP